MSTASHEIIVYADGAASPNPGPGGYGVVLIRHGQRQELSGGFRRTTNNRMEILGAIVGLRALDGESSGVTIHSDSEYLVKMINGGYAEQWRRNGWRRNKGKDPALNPDLWRELLDLSVLHQARFVWVRGHADSKENVRCDELAVAARKGKDLPPDEGYENPPVLHPVQMSLFDRVR